MPLSMIAVGLLGWTMLGLGVAAAVLIAAVLAPTDPVLASEVQVSKPAQDPEHDDDEVRFALTSEAGLNDGLAFLFTWAAVGIAIAGIAPSGWLGHWLAVDLVWRIAAGVGVGAACGWLLGRMLFSTASERRRITDGAHGFIALAATFLTYGLTELVHGYGFIAVFVAALVLRSNARHHDYVRVLHGFVEQIERLLTVAVLVLVGGAVSRGALEGIGLVDIVFVAAVLLVVRPLAGWIGLAGGVTRRRERIVIAFFGVRGVGSLFYLAFALQEANFPGGDRLWGVTLLAVLGSVILHGITATPAMRSLDRRHGRLPEEPAPA
jgi:NhaP-type Na+/H+ or K+/H+ antiporter